MTASHSAAAGCTNNTAESASERTSRHSAVRNSYPLSFITHLGWEQGQGSHGARLLHSRSPAVLLRPQSESKGVLESVQGQQSSPFLL